MAVPTAITLRNISEEGLKKAGYGNPVSEQTALVTRAEDAWMREIKNDIFNVSKKLTSLMTDAVIPLTIGRSRYDLPTDFSSLLSITLLSGTVTGTAQAGSTSTVTLASTDTSSSDIKGKEIVITGGTGANQISQVYSYDTVTKIASVYPSFSTAPGASSTYLIVDSYQKITESPVWDYDKMNFPFRNEKPSQYFPIGDADDGQFILAQAPDVSTYVIRIRYYADLMRIDLDGTLMNTLYRRWQNVWVLGITAKALEHVDDDGAEAAQAKYNQKIQELTMREAYGLDMSNIRFRMDE